MNTNNQTRETLVHPEALFKTMTVTAVAEFVFCARKGALAALHIQGDPSSPNFALGTIEHELRRRISGELRDRYRRLRSTSSVEVFRDDELLGVILTESGYVRTLARATHPLYFDQIESTLRDHTEQALLGEEEKRLQTYLGLLTGGASPEDAIDQVLPREVEHSLRSPRLQLNGRVDQVWVRAGLPAPVDLKTHGPELRKFFEESHWVQAALYGLLLEDAGASVAEVGLHYTYRGGPEFRPLDEELRARALTALRQAREQAARRGIPEVPATPEKCALCLHRSRCFGENRVANSAPEASRGPSLPVREDTSTCPSEAAVFVDWHLRLSRLLRHGASRSRKDVERWVKQQRHTILAERGAVEKISTRRMLKSLERLLNARLKAAAVLNHDAYFGGPRIENGHRNGSFLVFQSDRVTPWAHVEIDSIASAGKDVADICFRAMRDTGLPCLEATLVDQHGALHTFSFSDSERMKWASGLVSRTAPAAITAPDATNKHGTAPPAPAAGSGRLAGETPPRAPVPPASQYVGFIAEDHARPLKFGLKGDRVYGFLKEEHHAALAKEDFVIAEKTPTKEGDKRLLLRVLEIESAPRSAGTTTKSVSELESQLLLEPLSEQLIGNEAVASVANDDLSGYQLRVASADEVGAFLSLPRTGLPLGHLVASGEPVQVNFPFEPGDDSLFRSFFVVGAKGKGKTSFVREIVTLSTTFLGHPADSRPAVIVLDGEPNRSGDASEFCVETLRRAHERLGEQLGASILDVPTVREVRIERGHSGLGFSYGEIKVEDIVLLLPSLTETSANVLRRILRSLPDRGTGLRNLADVLEHLRQEIQSNGQVDGRTARAIAERLMSPQVEIFDQPAADAIDIRDLLTPGTVTVLNVVDLADDQRKVIALYLLLALEKLAEERGGVNALLVLDEAEKLFPRSRGGQAAPTTIQRVAHRVAGIAKRGRRRRFGMIICTQTPADVDRDIVANCDTKLVFNVSGSDPWLRENLGADLTQSVKTLRTGECYVDLRKVSAVQRPVKTKLFAT